MLIGDMSKHSIPQENRLIPYSTEKALPGRSVLVLAPHPDDEVFGCGGVLALHAACGVTLRVIVLTDGALGCTAPGSAGSASVIEVRQAESRAAAVELGLSPPEFWGVPDRQLEYGEALITRLVNAIQAHAADLVYAPSLNEAHPDHRALAMAAIEAVRRVGGAMQLALYEVGMPLRPNRLVDITAVLERKRAAMKCFASQLEIQRYDEQITALNRYRAYTLSREVLAAEAFEVVSAREIALNHLALFASEYRRRRELGFPIDGRRDQPLVSVIIRSMHRPTLEAALDSVALQTYSNVEVVVVNAQGGAHSDVGDCCGRFPLRIVNQNGMSLRRSAAANAGLDHAGGAYLIFLDDDDFMLPAHIEGLASVLGSAAGVRAAYSAVSCVDGENKPMPKTFGKPFSKIRLMSGNFLPIHSVLFRKDAATVGCRFDESLDLFEDWDFWMQLAETGDFRFLPSATAVYRITPAGGFGVAGGNAEDALRATRSLVAKWRRRWSPDALYALMEACRRSFEIMDERDATAASMRALEKRLDELECANRELQGELAAASARLQAVYHSRSWRLTWPLRRLVEFCRKRT